MNYCHYLSLIALMPIKQVHQYNNYTTEIFDYVYVASKTVIAIVINGRVLWISQKVGRFHGVAIVLMFITLET